MNEASMCNKKCTLLHEPVFFWFLLIKSKPTSLAPEELRFTAEKYICLSHKYRQNNHTQSLQMKMFAHFLCFQASLHLCLVTSLRIGGGAGWGASNISNHGGLSHFVLRGCILFSAPPHPTPFHWHNEAYFIGWKSNFVSSIFKKVGLSVCGPNYDEWSDGYGSFYIYIFFFLKGGGGE